MGPGWADPQHFRIGASGVLDALLAALEGTEALPAGQGLLMLPQEVIAHKRDGGRLPADEIRTLVEGLTSGAITEGQVAAFAMAVFFRGLDTDERVALTLAMRDSGRVLDWDLPGPVVDKHSTGGVGDNVSLMLAPALAACGAYVPMISGRGLGHTGGTLDKFDAIPGYATQPDADTFAPGGARDRLRHHRPDRRHRPRGPPLLRHPRRHRHGRVDRPHHGLDPLEETRRRPRRPDPRRQVRLRRLHGHACEDARALARTRWSRWRTAPAARPARSSPT